MAQRAIRPAETAKGTPRAKSIPPRVGPGTQRVIDRFAEANAAFEAALSDRNGVGRIDESYGDLCACAAAVLRALLDDPNTARVFSSELVAGLAAHSRGERSVGERPEDDIALAEHALAR